MSAKVGALPPLFENLAKELEYKQKLLKCKNTVYITTLSVRTLNRIGQQLEPTVSVLEHNIDIVCVQEHRCYHSEVEIKYHDADNG